MTAISKTEEFKLSEEKPAKEFPFAVCETCGSPKLDNQPLSLVLMFDNEDDRQELIEAIREEKPSMKAYKY